MNSELTETTSSKLQRLFPKISIAVLIVATVVAYSPMLQNLFNGDDYAHFAWVIKAAADPKLVLQNFYSSWMGVFTTYFYRPLCAVFMYTDYCIWGSNAFGYHLTSLLFHLAASTAIGLLTYQIATGTRETRWIWTLSAAGLFALYPIHPEASTWIACRGDVLSTLFCVLCVWFFVRWNYVKVRRLFAASVFCYVLGVCSKESAVTIPAILFLYSSLVRKDGFFLPTRNTLPFWLVLAAYFQVRYISFGTFLGGYSNALGSDPILSYAPRWLHSLQIMFVPFNFYTMSHNNLLVYLWIASLVISFIAIAVLSIKNDDLRRRALFLILWTAITIIPIIKFFWLRSNFEGTRNVYISTAPLCMFLTLGLSYLEKPRLLKRLGLVALGAMLLAAGISLYRVNKTWEVAGMEMRSFTKAVNDLYRANPNPPLFYFAGVPNQIAGAAVGINAIDAMMQPPFLEHPVNFGGYFAPEDKTFTFGARRQNFLVPANSIPVVYIWNTQNKTLVPFRPVEDEDYERIWEGKDLAELLWNSSQVSVSKNGLVALAGEKKDKNATITLGFKNQVDGWKAQVLTLKFDFIGGNVFQEPPFVTVNFKNNLQSSPRLSDPSDEVAIAPGGKGEIVTIPMRGNSTWSLGGDITALTLRFPRGWNIYLKEVDVSNGAHQIPTIKLDPKLKRAKEGVILASEMGDSCKISFDTSNIPGASKTLLEITDANTPFGVLNSPALSEHTSRTMKSSQTKGEFEINRKDFPASGIYQLRVRALDAKDKPVGLASDHVILMNTTIQ
jgi:hypothetical protein